MRDDTLMRPILGGEYVPTGMGAMIRSIVSDFYNYNAAIGYTFLFYLNNMAGSAGTKVLSIDGVTPDSQTIGNGAYPYIQTVYAVTTGNESENTKKFIEWILSAQGQELVRRTGYTPVR
jgi:phosphate transport system substrate-binding protein